MKSAVHHEQQGNLYQALMAYRILRTLSPDSSKRGRDVERVESLISKRTDRLMTLADNKYNKGKLQSARSLYLKILTLEPKHKAAFSRLRAINETELQLKMRQKVSLSQRYRKNSSRKKRRNSEDEGYTYSRQAILQAESRAKDVSYITELENHITKYPNDSELKLMLMNVRIDQARKAFRASSYDNALHHLTAAEGLLSSDGKLIKKLSDTRKELARELYLEGVRSARSAPLKAIKIWHIALRFDPDDKRTQLRIETLGPRKK
jgi:tetratricopeptide (TPR) repeat protein